MKFPFPVTILGDRSDWRHRHEHKTRFHLEDSFITCFQMDGCMANVANWQWTGVVYDFEPSDLEPHTYTALVKVLKHVDRNGDVRDGFVGHERVWISNSQLQYIHPGMYFLYK